MLVAPQNISLQLIISPPSNLQDVSAPGAAGHDPAAGAEPPAAVPMEVSDVLHCALDLDLFVLMTGLTTHYFGLCNV